MNKYLLTAMNWENLTISELDQNIESAQNNFDMEVGSYIFNICKQAVKLRRSFDIMNSHVDVKSTQFYNNSVSSEEKYINYHGWRDVFNESKDTYFFISLDNEEDYLNKIKEMNSD